MLVWIVTGFCIMLFFMLSFVVVLPFRTSQITRECESIFNAALSNFPVISMYSYCYTIPKCIKKACRNLQYSLNTIVSFKFNDKKYLVSDIVFSDQDSMGVIKSKNYSLINVPVINVDIAQFENDLSFVNGIEGYRAKDGTALLIKDYENLDMCYLLPFDEKYFPMIPDMVMGYNNDDINNIISSNISVVEHAIAKFVK